MHVLGVLEGDPERFRALLAPFRAMIDFQIESQATRPARRVRHERAPKPPRRRVPDEMIDRFGDLVAIVGEANAWPHTGPDGTQAHPDELVHWVAERVATGERFEAIAAPSNPLSPSTTYHIRLDEGTLRAGGTRREMFDRFSRFVRPTDIVCAWGDHSIGLYQASGGVLPEKKYDLRAVAKRAENRRFGSLESYVSTKITSSGISAGSGRAHARLSLLVAAARKLAGVCHDET